MSEPAKKSGWVKGILVGVLGIGGGAAGTYATTLVNTIAKPPLPVANFAVAADGLTVTCQNHATGESGWWDFGDGTSLEPFAADRPAVPHAYAKPGTYTVKLTVRNFFGDENERSVPVEAAADGKDNPLPPLIATFAVNPVSASSVAPATFRVTGEVRNADHCVWDFGDGRLEVADGGKIDRLVTFEKPGAFPLLLVAHNGKGAVKQASEVRVDAAATGALVAVVKITDAGVKVERASRAETVAVPAPKDKARPGFTKTITARPGFSLVEAGGAKPDDRVKNLKVVISGDKKSATVSGERADLAAGKGGDADLLLPMKLTEERATPTTGPVTMVTGVLPPLAAIGKVSTVLPLPPLPAGLDAPKRTISVELRRVGPDGKSVVIAEGAVAGRDPVSLSAKPSQLFVPSTSNTTAIYDIDAVKITHEIHAPIGGAGLYGGS